jgi:hypothetical protein
MSVPPFDELLGRYDNLDSARSCPNSTSLWTPARPLPSPLSPPSALATSSSYMTTWRPNSCSGTLYSNLYSLSNGFLSLLADPLGFEDPPPQPPRPVAKARTCRWMDMAVTTDHIQRSVSPALRLTRSWPTDQVCSPTRALGSTTNWGSLNVSPLQSSGASAFLLSPSRVTQGNAQLPSLSCSPPAVPSALKLISDDKVYIPCPQAPTHNVASQECGMLFTEGNYASKM